ncbi:MAG: recombinase family protein [Candidatus Omnitrophica bacterium]|nr:recombinase family protein [Candidatus Omnitrophota bacterium]
MEKEVKQKIHCAIYTRKSIADGLDRDFTTLDAQRESCESYIASQKNEGWICLPDKYDDGGFTGANIERPALQKLLSDIRAGKINCVVVYKVDRLSRSLLDFAELLSLFEKHNVTFVSVTQHFNTQNSMGRLTLNILLSFAQFEREIISERTRDKMAASKKKGKWVGGKPPLGYDIDKANRRLVINHKEAAIVKEIFDLYLEKRSLLSVAIALNQKNYLTKSHATLKGTHFGGTKFKSTSIQTIVKNPFYIGNVNHAGVLYQGEHERIIPDEIFQKAQEILNNNRRERKVAGVVTNVGLLNNILRCKACDSTMYYIYTKKGVNKYHYYLCMNAQKHGYKCCPTRLISAQTIENKFMEFLRTASKDDQIKDSTWEALTLEEKIPVLKSLVKVTYYDAIHGILEITLHNNDRVYSFDLKLADLKHIPYHRQQARINKEPLIRQNLILAHQIDQVAHERKCTLKEIAGWIAMSPARICHIANMLLISPQIQEEILLSNDKALFNIPEYKLREVSIEVDWKKQQEIWNSLVKSHQN